MSAEPNPPLDSSEMLRVFLLGLEHSMRTGPMPSNPMQIVAYAEQHVMRALAFTTAVRTLLVREGLWP